MQKTHWRSRTSCWKFWWLDNSRSQGSQWQLRISKQSPVRSRGAGLGHPMDAFFSVQNKNFSRLLNVGSKDGSWEELAWEPLIQELYHPRDSLWILAAIPVCRNDTGLPVLAFRHVYLTTTLELDTCTGGVPLSVRSSLSRASVSLDVVVGDEDELGWELEEELVDKPGTTIGTKFSVLQIIRIPSLMRCGFWPLIHS